MRTDTKTIIGALRVLCNDIDTDDGVINACLAEAALRMEQLERVHECLSALMPYFTNGETIVPHYLIGRCEKTLKEVSGK